MKRYLLCLCALLPFILPASQEVYAQAHQALRDYVKCFPEYTDAYETYGDAHVRAMVTIREEQRWGELSDDLFLNAILPPVSLREQWVDWLPHLQPLAKEMTANAKTPLEAAMLINRKIWKRINVVYSTKRDFPHQDPLHSMRIQKASCTGLSIILIDACRSVGIPARLVGCLWAKKPGNHSWVEVYSEGRWYPLGAFEDTPPTDLWFAKDAAQAIATIPKYAIYATRLTPHEQTFFYGWEVPAENVTAHYTKAKKKQTGLTIHIAAERKGQRVEVPLEINGKRYQTPGPLRDLNDYVTIQVPEGASITYTLDGKTFTRPLREGAIFVEQL